MALRAAISDLWKRQATDLEIPYLVPYELRHTFGTVLREQGVDIYTISRVMGHGDVVVTDKIYVHNDYDVLRKNMGLRRKIRYRYHTGVVRAKIQGQTGKEKGRTNN